MKPIQLQPATFRCLAGKKWFAVQGGYVPGTGKLFGVDEREPGDWRITHIPSGLGITMQGHLKFGCSSQATQVAGRFCREAQALGVDLVSSDPKVIGHVENFTDADKRAFWERVL